MRLARRIFLPNFWMIPTITGANSTMNSVSFQLIFSATANANAASSGVLQRVRKSAPEPPYSSGKMSPTSPRSPMALTVSTGNT